MDRPVVVCMPTSEPDYTETATVQKCSKCGIEIWLAENTVKHIKASGYEDFDLLCVSCADGQVQEKMKSEAVMFMMPSDEQLAEIAASQNVPFEDFKKRVKEGVERMNMAANFAQN